MRPIRIFSIVFNEQYLDWFERACVRSLCWPKNRAALKQFAGWDLWSTPQDAERAAKIAQRVGVPVQIHAELKPGSWDDKEALKPNLTHALTTQLQRCRAFLWIAPDSIFGDGSIASMLEIGAVPGICVATAPLRVKAEGFIEAMGDGPLSNAELVRLGMARAHPAFLDSEATRQYTNSYLSGVSWRTIGEGLYAVTHLKHSSYLMQATEVDAKWFADMKKFGAYDHSFPTRLVEQERQRVIGSSDAAFVVELTPATAHMPKCRLTDAARPDAYHLPAPHHAANRNVTVIWRAA